jgi:hypothetical protein
MHFDQAETSWVLSQVAVHHGLSQCIPHCQEKKLQNWNQHHLKQISLQQSRQMDYLVHQWWNHISIQWYVWGWNLAAQDRREGSNHCSHIDKQVIALATQAKIAINPPSESNANSRKRHGKKDGPYTVAEWCSIKKEATFASNGNMYHWRTGDHNRGGTKYTSSWREWELIPEYWVKIGRLFVCGFVCPPGNSLGIQITSQFWDDLLINFLKL